MGEMSVTDESPSVGDTHVGQTSTEVDSRSEDNVADSLKSDQPPILVVGSGMVLEHSHTGETYVGCLRHLISQETPCNIDDVGAVQEVFGALPEVNLCQSLPVTHAGGVSEEPFATIFREIPYKD